MQRVSQALLEVEQTLQAMRDNTRPLQPEVTDNVQELPSYSRQHRTPSPSARLNSSIGSRGSLSARESLPSSSPQLCLTSYVVLADSASSPKHRRVPSPSFSNRASAPHSADQHSIASALEGASPDVIAQAVLHSERSAEMLDRNCRFPSTERRTSDGESLTDEQTAVLNR